MIKKTLILASLGVAFVLGGTTDSFASIDLSTYVDGRDQSDNYVDQSLGQTNTDNSGQTLNGGVNTTVKIPVKK